MVYISFENNGIHTIFMRIIQLKPTLCELSLNMHFTPPVFPKEGAYANIHTNNLSAQSLYLAKKWGFISQDCFTLLFLLIERNNLSNRRYKEMLHMQLPYIQVTVHRWTFVSFYMYTQTV